MIGEIIIGFKDAVGEPVIAEKLPDVFDWVEFGAFRRQRGGPALRERMAAWLRWILGSITPPISPRLPA